MKRSIIFILFFFIFLQSVANAQDDWETYTFRSGAFDYPSTWIIEENNATVYVSNNDTLLASPIRQTNTLLDFEYKSGDIAIEMSFLNFEDDDNLITRTYSENSNIDALNASFLSGLYTGFYVSRYQLQNNITDIQVKYVQYLDLSNDNHLTVLSDDYIDIYILGLAFLNEEDVTKTELGLVTWIVPTGEFEQHEETVMHIIKSIQISNSMDASTTDN